MPEKNINNQDSSLNSNEIIYFKNQNNADSFSGYSNSNVKVEDEKKINVKLKTTDKVNLDSLNSNSSNNSSSTFVMPTDENVNDDEKLNGDQSINNQSELSQYIVNNSEENNNLNGNDLDEDFDNYGLTDDNNIAHNNDVESKTATNKKIDNESSLNHDDESDLSSFNEIENSDKDEAISSEEIDNSNADVIFNNDSNIDTDKSLDLPENTINENDKSINSKFNRLYNSHDNSSDFDSENKGKNRENNYLFNKRINNASNNSDLSNDNNSFSSVKELPKVRKSDNSNKSDTNNSIDNNGDILSKINRIKKNIGLIKICCAVFIIVFAIIIILTLFFSIFGSEDNNSGNSLNNIFCDSSTVSPISVTKTSLSKEEFISKMGEYSSGYSKYSIFKENAELIYDLGVEYGINPELAVIRAETEGYSPGTNYNYWGIGCYNGETCRGSYNSFENGLRAFYSTIKSYNTTSIYEVLGKYAYIGNNWYYPGNSADGGCYYYPYVKEFLSEKRSAEVAESCSSGTEIDTNEEDQLAYTKYQVETNTMPLRKKIFGLESDNVSVCSKFDVTLTTNPTNQETTKIMTSSDGTVSSILASNGSSVAEFNNTLLANTIEKGIGTREAVGAAAMLLINTFETYGYRIPYSYSGGWGWAYTDQNGVDHNYNVNTYYGINPNMGEAIYSGGSFGYNPGTPNNTYYYLGLDCSGFVTWSLNNGGLDYGLTQATNFKTDPNIKSYPASSTSEYVGRMGDVLSSNEHVVLVLEYNNSDQSYTVAEAGGKNLGVLIRKQYITSLSKYKVVDMSYYYENKVNSNYEEDFTNGRKG